MICRLTNILIGITYSIFEVTSHINEGLFEKSVSIADLIAWSLITILAIICMSWWWIPLVIIYRSIRWFNICDFLTSKRFKCGK